MVAESPKILASPFKSPSSKKEIWDCEVNDLPEIEKKEIIRTTKQKYLKIKYQ